MAISSYKNKVYSMFDFSPLVDLGAILIKKQFQIYQEDGRQSRRRKRMWGLLSPQQ